MSTLEERSQAVIAGVEELDPDFVLHLPSSTLKIVFLQQSVDEAFDYTAVSTLPGTTTNTTIYSGDVFAVWSPSAPVPEPTETALLLTGLGLLSLRAARRVRPND